MPRLGPLILTLLALSPALTLAPAIADDTPVVETPSSGSGARTWERCAVCHGADGAGRPDGTFPKIAGQHASVVRSQLEAIRQGERPNPVMQPHVEPLADVRDVVDVAAFVAAMPRDAVCHVGPGDDLERGARLYQGGCASCHGDSGEGEAEEAVPWLACQHHAYLVRRARQLASWGRNAHPETSPPLSRMTDPELRAVMDYVARMPATPPKGPAGGALGAAQGVGAAAQAAEAGAQGVEVAAQSVETGAQALEAAAQSVETGAQALE